MGVFAQILVKGWQPSKLDSTTVYDEFTALLQGLGLKWSKADYAPAFPEYCREMLVGENTTAWHNDSHCNWVPPGLVVWSNRLPTEIQHAMGSTPFECGDGDVVLVANWKAVHRQPRAPRAGMDRWFCRVWLEGKIELV